MLTFKKSPHTEDKPSEIASRLKAKKNALSKEYEIGQEQERQKQFSRKSSLESKQKRRFESRTKKTDELKVNSQKES